jgi:hypothetical protein
MPVAVDQKKPQQNLGHHPRLARIAKQKKPVSALGDDPAQFQLFWGLSEKAYRERLFADFCGFCRRHNAWVISPSHEGSRARVQIAEGSPLLERLKQFPRYPVATLPGISHRLTHGHFVSVQEIEVQLWR